MTNIKNNISKVVDNNICTYCGMCAGVCPSKAIEIKVNNGLFVPFVNNDQCKSDKGCNICLSSCPGIGINLKAIARTHFSGAKWDDVLGAYLNCYTGYSTNYDIRYHSASGGLLSQFLIFLIEKKYITGAIVTRFSSQHELLVDTFLATTKEDIISARSSIYAPVTFKNVIKLIRESSGQVAVVGLPCHIQAIRKYSSINKNISKKIFACFSLYCSSGRSFNLTEYVFKHNKVDSSRLKYFKYRDEGCMGSMVAKYGNSCFKCDFQKYYLPLRSFFIPKRCMECIDLFGELGDISFGDIHYDKYAEDKVGVNSVVVRNESLEKLLLEAKAEGYISLQKISPELLMKSQRMIKQKKGRSGTFIKIERSLGHKVPVYDINIRDTNPLNSFLFYVHSNLQMFIGKHKYLWWIINILRRKNINE